MESRRQEAKDAIHWTMDSYILASIWDLLAQVNSDPDKEAPRFPRPQPAEVKPIQAAVAKRDLGQIAQFMNMGG